MPPKKQPQPQAKTVHLVMQRYRWCKILLNETEWRTVGSSSEQNSHCGWLVYTSFAQGVTPESIQKAVLTVLQIPFGTFGHWQEKGASRPQSLLQMVQQQVAQDKEENDAPRLSIVLCPQANLTSRVERNGKSVQYRGQCDKDSSAQFFAYFGLYLQALLAERVYQARQETPPATLAVFMALPWTEALQQDDTTWRDVLPAVVSVVVASFGQRQGLEFSSDMGPFCHAVQI